MSVFVDTSALYALLVRTENQHAEMTRAFQASLEEGRALWTTSYVLVESTALLQHRLGLAPVRDLCERILPLLNVQWVDQDLHRRALARFIAQDRRQVSLVDCVSVEAMRAAGTRLVLGLDPHLTEGGARLLPDAPG